MAKNTENKGKKCHSRLLIYALVALVVFSTLVVGTYAKYTMGNRTDGYIFSPNFYFTSDLLKETAVEYTLNPEKDGEAEISFQVRNFADDLRISDKKINFKITVSPAKDVTVKVDGKKADGGSLNPKTGASANVTISGLKNGESYQVSVTGVAGFATTLRAKVTVKPGEKQIFKHIDNNHDSYVLLTVWTQNISGDVEISFPQGLIPDDTDSAMRDVNNFSDGKYGADTFTDEVSFGEVYSSHVYRFFKTSDYESGAFTVTLGGKEAIAAIPK